MQQDQLLQQWKTAKETCKKVVQLSISSNLNPTEQLPINNPSQQHIPQPNTTTNNNPNNNNPNNNNPNHNNPNNNNIQTKKQFIAVYDIIYRLCSTSSVEENRVIMVYKDYQDILKNAVVMMSKRIVEERDVYRLKILRKVCDAYEDILKRLKHMFAILDRPYINKQHKIDELDRTGINIILSTLFSQQSQKQYLSLYFKQTQKIRKTHSITDSQILKDYIQILYKFHQRLTSSSSNNKQKNKKIRTLYTDFQQLYLKEASQYYVEMYDKFVELLPKDYVIQVWRLYKLERKMLEECFGCCSDSFINKIFNAQFLESYKNTLLSHPKGLKHLLQSRQLPSIQTLTTLYKTLSPQLQSFKQPFQQFIFQQFSSLLTQIQSQLTFKKNHSQQIYIESIQRIMRKNIELLEILQASFAKFGEFVGYYRNGMEKAVEKVRLQIGIEEMLAVYADVRFSREYPSAQAMKQDVANILSIFQCLQNKDLFLLKHFQKLCKRIISLPSPSIQTHQHLVYHLKLYSGDKQASNIEQLLNQYKQSLQNQKQFKEYQIQLNKNIQYKISYYVCLYAFKEAIWPIHNVQEWKMEQLPEVFVRGFKVIQKWEEEKGLKRVVRLDFGSSRVRWMYYMDVEPENKHSQFIFDTNGIQALLLNYIYSHRPQKQSPSILHATHRQLPLQLIQSCLHKLCVPPQNILQLQKSPQQQFYRFNPNIKTNKRFLKYDTPIQTHQQQQSLFQKQQIIRQRQYVIDANVVKLMKFKKVLGYGEIVEQVGKMIKVFNPSLRDIKAAVERMLAKEIIVRDQKDKNVIKYKS